MTVRASDADASSNGVATFETNLAQVTDQRATQLFSLDRKSGQVSLKRDLGLRDVQEPVYLPIIVTDEAVPSERKTSTTTLTVVGAVADGGESVGAFSQGLYETVVRENAPVGTPIGQVDLETAGVAASFYVSDCRSSRGSKRGLFAVDRETGQVRTASVIDREVEGSEVVIDIVAVSSTDGSLITTKMKVRENSMPCRSLFLLYYYCK